MWQLLTIAECCSLLFSLCTNTQTITGQVGRSFNEIKCEMMCAGRFFHHIKIFIFLYCHPHWLIKNVVYLKRYCQTDKGCKFISHEAVPCEMTKCTVYMLFLPCNVVVCLVCDFFITLTEFLGLKCHNRNVSWVVTVVAQCQISDSKENQKHTNCCPKLQKQRHNLKKKKKKAR